LRIIAAAGTDELIHIGLAALQTAIDGADWLAPQERRTAVAGLTGERRCHDVRRPETPPPVMAIMAARYGHSGRTGGWFGPGHEVRVGRTVHSLIPRQ
jgi:hypothetical protein